MGTMMKCVEGTLKVRNNRTRQDCYFFVFLNNKEENRETEKRETEEKEREKGGYEYMSKLAFSRRLKDGEYTSPFDPFLETIRRRILSILYKYPLYICCHTPPPTTGPFTVSFTLPVTRNRSTQTGRSGV